MRKHGVFFYLVGLTLAAALFRFDLPSSTEASVATQQQEQPLRVVTKEIEPFVIKEQDRLTGFSIDVWEEIALVTGLPFEFFEVETVSDQLAAVEEGEAEVAIAAISMTPEREERIDFSYPYYRSGLQILATQRSTSSLVRLITAFVTTDLLLVIGGLLIIMVIVGHLIWWTERNTNPDFPQSYWPGVWEGLWWSAVTMTTVGYGDKKVHGIWGRILGMVWMFSGIFLIANFTAGVTAELTVSELQSSIRGVEDLRGKKVATVAGTTSAEYLREQRIPFRGVEVIEDAYEMLEEGLIDAIVYDAPILQYYVTTTDNESVLLVGSPFKREDYGIALQPNSPYEEEINRALLEIVVSGSYQEIADKWFGSTEE